MGFSRFVLAAVGVALAMGLVAAGCGGNSEDEATQASTQPAAAGGGVAIAVADSALGAILVDDAGRTLYLFEKDSDGESACTGDCAVAWPPLTSEGMPTAGDGADQAKLGTTTRPDGIVQVTYAGHPLYYYAEDTQPGDTNGQEVNDVWYVVSPSGDAIEDTQAETRENESQPGPYG
jgi:predicted lipoprotein with Yx(FWY)xxD motif